jgi:hypothetical protein
MHWHRGLCNVYIAGFITGKADVGVAVECLPSTTRDRMNRN